MELIEIKDLEVGDEILISCQSYFKYLRILKKPTLGTHGYYKTVKCSSARTSVARQWTNYAGVVKTYYVHKWELTPDDHNVTQYLHLNDRQLLLVKKNEQ